MKYKKSILTAVFGILAIAIGYSQSKPHSQSQKLHSRSIAFDKYAEVPASESGATDDDAQWISILVHNNADRYIKEVEIKINGIHIEGITNNHGSYVYRLPKNISTKKKVTVKLSSKDSYEAKTVSMTTGQLLNKTHVIIMDDKSSTEKMPRRFKRHDRDRPRGHFGGMEK